MHGWQSCSPSGFELRTRWPAWIVAWLAAWRDTWAALTRSHTAAIITSDSHTSDSSTVAANFLPSPAFSQAKPKIQLFPQNKSFIFPLGFVLPNWNSPIIFLLYHSQPLVGERRKILFVNSLFISVSNKINKCKTCVWLDVKLSLWLGWIE